MYSQTCSDVSHYEPVELYHAVQLSCCARFVGGLSLPKCLLLMLGHALVTA